MSRLNDRHTILFYRIKFKKKLDEFNRRSSLPSYFEPMIGDKKKVKIAELGAGPICTIGNFWKDVKVDIFASDVLQPHYQENWVLYNATPIVPIEYQDMESLTYPDEFFDIVHCANALDHTPNPKQAIKEIKRVCKKGGWIYLKHSPNQRRKYGGIHAWDINIKDGVCVFSNPNDKFVLDDFKTRWEGEFIVSTCKI